MIRTALPDLRTEPSSTCATCSVRAISGMPVSLPLNANDEVRAVTCSCGIFASRFSSSSEMPSEKNSFDFSSLMFTNGSTAIELSLVADAAGVATGVADPVDMAAGAFTSLDLALRRDPKGSNTNNPIASTSRPMMM